ncbi:MAG TPA: hypothetical protein VG452_08445 [Egibacteraceae bacterium]|nr:hypothetical protein [Egibacteraceae bacterium]
MLVRVLLEKLSIIDSHDPVLEDVDEMIFDVRVRTDDHDGAEQQTRVPSDRTYRPITGWSFQIEDSVFEGDVEEHLSIHIEAVDADTGKVVGTYSREFTADPDSWLGTYAPHDASGPEHLDYWQVHYRIERAGSPNE